MTALGEERRIYKRKEVSFPVRVKGHDSFDSEWFELTHLIDVTPFGARFTIHHLTEVGRLLHLLLMMPRQYRCFDHAEDQYRVWSLVRHIKFLPPAGAEGLRLDVGVALVGKHPPASHSKDPMTRYEVAPSRGEGQVWQLVAHSSSSAGISESQRRNEARYKIPIEVSLEAVDSSGQITAAENTVTEDISRNGASVFTSLDLGRGRFVRLTSPQYQISVMAVVRASYTKPDNFTRLGLQFLDAQWPLTGIE